MNYSDDGFALTQKFEGCRLNAYQDSVGIWTIGFGHTAGVLPGMSCTQEQAEAWLKSDIHWAESAVNQYVTAALTQGEFDALVDFVFNLGVGNFVHSTLLRLLNSEDYDGAADEFPKWNRAGGKILPSLTARRLAEQEMFKNGA